MSNAVNLPYSAQTASWPRVLICIIMLLSLMLSPDIEKTHHASSKISRRSPLIYFDSVAKCPLMKFPVAKCPLMKFPVAKSPLMKFPVTKCPLMKFPVTKCPLMKFPVATSPLMKFPVVANKPP